MLQISYIFLILMKTEKAQRKNFSVPLNWFFYCEVDDWLVDLLLLSYLDISNVPSFSS